MIVPFLALSTVLVAMLAGRMMLSAPGFDPGPSRAPRILVRFRNRRDDKAVARELPGLFEALARSLRAGLSVREALADARSNIEGPLGADLAWVVGRIDGGATVHQAMSSWAAARSRAEGVRLAAIAVSLSSGSGASVAAAIDGVADTLREQISLHQEVAAMSAQARASAALIVSLPLGFAFVAAVADPDTLHYIFGTDSGRILLFVGVTLDIAAYLWMRQIVKSIR